MSVPEDDLYSKIFVCLKHPIRRRILRILSDGPRSFSDLQKEFRIESSHLSYHLDGLENLLYTTEDGKYALSHFGEAAFSMMKDVEEPRVTPYSGHIAVKKNPRRHFKLGRFSVPLWPVAVLIVLMISSGVLGYYFWNTFTVPLEIKEPIEVVGYPPQWSLYPGEIAQFNVTVRNHASLNYSVVLDFRTSDIAYQQHFITFSDETYTVVPGQQNLEAWLNVTADAPPASLNVTVAVLRVTDGRNLLLNGDFETGTLTGWDVVGACSISNTIVHGGSYSAYISDNNPYENWIEQKLNLPANDNYYFEAWVYPLKVGSLGETQYPRSDIFFHYYNKSSMLPAFRVHYVWSWNDYILSDSTHGNGSDTLVFTLGFNRSEWNLISRNLTEDIRSHFAGIDLSQFVLYDMYAQYHFSNASPGAFYVDDLKISRAQFAIS